MSGFLLTIPATKIEFGSDGSVTFTDPDGTVRTEPPFEEPSE